MERERKAQTLKVVCLIALTLQTAACGLSLRYARTRPGDKFLASTAVLLTDVVKLLICLGKTFIEEKNVWQWFSVLKNLVTKQSKSTLKMCIPSLLYVIQNNLIYFSATHLDTASLQVTNQLKIMTTAVFSVIMLKHTLSIQQWASLVLLIVGVAMVQLTTTSESTAISQEQNRLVGFAAVIGASFLSGLSGIFFEIILKSSRVSLWIRNVQLNFLSLFVSLVSCFVNDFDAIKEKGFFQGYDLFTLYLIALQACGGIIVSLVINYAGNLLKGFATSLAIVISCVVSIYIFDFLITMQFVIGVVVVFFSIFLFNYKRNTKKSNIV